MDRSQLPENAHALGDLATKMMYKDIFPTLQLSALLIFNNNIYIIHKITLPALMLPDINIETVPLVALYPEQ